METLFGLVAGFDEHVCTLLQKIAGEPLGSELMIQAGLCRALEMAAKKYQYEEKQVYQRLEARGSSFNAALLEALST